MLGTAVVEVRLEYRSLPHLSLALAVIDDGYAGPIQAGPSFMQAIPRGLPYLSTFTMSRRLSESNLADDSRTSQAMSERLWTDQSVGADVVFLSLVVRTPMINGVRHVPKWRPSKPSDLPVRYGMESGMPWFELGRYVHEREP